MESTEPDRLRVLGEAVRAHRDEWRLTQAEAAALAGFSSATWIKTEKARGPRASSNYREIERTLKWDRGTIDLILQGNEPPPLPSPEAIASAKVIPTGADPAARHPSGGRSLNVDEIDRVGIAAGKFEQAIIALTEGVVILREIAPKKPAEEQR
jgi:hypothetical protein